MKFKYVCSDCGKEFVTDKIVYTCPECSKKDNDKDFRHGILNVELDKDYLQSLQKKESVSYDDFFIYPLKFKKAFPVFSTPLSAPVNIIKEYGFKNLFFKLDCLLPSGSFKDRATEAVIAQCIHHGEDTIVLASTGNAGAATSCAGAACGVKVVLFVPESAPRNKLMQSILYNADVRKVKGTYDDAFALSIKHSNEFGGINRNTAYNPITIEGKKSVSIDFYNQLGRKVPDIVYVPVGDGCIISGVAKGFKDLYDSGLIKKLPHLVCCQSDKSDAISKAFATGEFKNLDNATTICDSISVSSPAAGRLAVKRIKESDGWCTVVSDDEILSSQRELAKSGIFAEPAASASFAAFKKDKDMIASKFGKDVSIGILITGTAFKDMKVFD